MPFDIFLSCTENFAFKYDKTKQKFLKIIKNTGEKYTKPTNKKFVKFTLDIWIRINKKSWIMIWIRIKST